MYAFTTSASKAKDILAFGAKEAIVVGRGVTYWEEGQDKRILFAGGNHLVALDARTGKPIETFGEQGKVNLNVGLRDDPSSIAVSMTSPGIIYKDLIIVGSRLPDLYGTPPVCAGTGCRYGKTHLALSDGTS